jgi:hypothetical protein
MQLRLMRADIITTKKPTERNETDSSRLDV